MMCQTIGGKNNNECGIETLKVGLILDEHRLKRTFFIALKYRVSEIEIAISQSADLLGHFLPISSSLD